MKKSVFAILALFLCGCGTFAVKVEIVPRASDTPLPQVQLTRAAATLQAVATGFMGDEDTFRADATRQAAQTAFPDDAQAQSRAWTQAAATGQVGAAAERSAYATRVYATIDSIATAYNNDPVRQSAAWTQSEATLQAENLATPVPTATPMEPSATPTPWALSDGQPISLAAIQMSDTSHGWGIESTGHLVRTGDGGWTWTDLSPVQMPFDPQGFFAFNDQTVWVVPAQLEVTNVVWSTRDGGTTWQASQPIQLGDVHYSPLGLQFPDARHGWLLLLASDGAQGSRVLLYKSSDAGANWSPVSTLNDSQMQSYLPATNTSMVFFDGQTGWLGGWWGKDDPNQWLVLKTVDGGTHWGTDEIPLPKLNALACDGRPIVNLPAGSLAVEMSCTIPKDPKYLFHHVYYLSTATAPVWRTWALTGNFLAADFLNASQGWMMVSSPSAGLNSIQSSKDRGKDWTTLGQVSWRQARFDFVDVRDGWAIVGNGYGTALVRTENGGKIWVEIRPVAGQ